MTGSDIPQAVSGYYDTFLRSRMVEYRVFGNRRIDLAVDRIQPLLRPDSKVLDVGCGIGMVSERIGRRVSRGQVLGVDVSPDNIWYAKRTVRAANVRFEVLDVAANPSALRMIIGALGGPADVVVLVDVIEHMPEADREQLFGALRSVSADRASLLLTYPSPAYQRHLRDHSPDELQIIDNIIDTETLIRETGAAGYHLKHYSLEDVWRQNQYCHTIFQTAVPVHPLSGLSRGWLQQQLGKVQSFWLRRVLAPWRRWKYVTRVFKP